MFEQALEQVPNILMTKINLIFLFVFFNYVIHEIVYSVAEDILTLYREDLTARLIQ